MSRQNPSSGATSARLTARRITAGLLLGALLLSSRSALADARTEAKGHFKKGMGAIAEGKYEEGISELQRAYEILPHPNVLYNIARAYAEEGDLENAITFYKKYLEGDPPDKDEITQVVAALDARRERQQAIAAAAQSQQLSPTTAPTTATTPTPGTTTPGTTPAGPTAPANNPVAQRPTAPLVPEPGGGAPVNVGAAKTEDVFEESVVTASKGAQSPLDAPNSTSIITEQDIRLSGITRIPELLRRLAGVDIMETTGSQTEVSLRGFNRNLSNKVLVLIDGRSTAIDLLGTTFWATFPIGVEDIERIEVVRGPGSALYGADAFNGVINVITKQPGDGPSGVSVSYGSQNTAHGSVWASGRDKETAYRISAGYDYMPRWSNDAPAGRVDLNFANSDQYIDPNTSQKTARIYGHVTRDLGAGVTVGLTGGYTSGPFQVGGYSPINDVVLNADTSTIMANLTSKHFEVKAFYNGIRGTNSVEESQIGQSLDPARFNLNTVNVEAQYIDDRKLGAFENTLHIGLGYRFREAYWTWLDEQRSENFEAVYLHDEAKLHKFAFIGDLRGDYVPYLGRIVVSPKGSILFHPTDQSTIRGIVATAFRIPNFLEGYVNLPTQLPFSGGDLLARGTSPDLGPNFKLNPEQTVTEELGYLNQDSDYFVFDSAVFHNYVKDLIDLQPNRAVTLAQESDPTSGAQFDPSTGLYPLFFGGWENQCQAYNVYGGEFGLRTFPTEGLDIYANYTLMDVQEDYNGCSAAQRSVISPDARTSAHKVNAGVQVRTKANIDGSVDFSYVSPQDWSEQIQNVQQQRIIYQSFHLDAYTLLNARIGYRFLAQHAEISAIGFNILNDQHREHPFGQLIGQRFMGMFTYRF